MRKSVAHDIVVAGIFIVVAATASAPNGQTVEIPGRPAVRSVSELARSEYVSSEGLFRIGLPPPVGEPIWRFPDGEIRLGYFDYFWAMKSIELTSFEGITHHFERDT